MVKKTTVALPHTACPRKECSCTESPVPPSQHEQRNARRQCVHMSRNTITDQLPSRSLSTPAHTLPTLRRNNTSDKGCPRVCSIVIAD